MRVTRDRLLHTYQRDCCFTIPENHAAKAFFKGDPRLEPESLSGVSDVSLRMRDIAGSGCTVVYFSGITRQIAQVAHYVVQGYAFASRNVENISCHSIRN